MLSSDRWIALALAVLAIAVFAAAFSFPAMAGLAVGPGLFPMVLSMALLAAAGMLALQPQEKSAAPAQPDEAPQPRHPQGGLRLLAVLAACALFAGLGKTLGFVIVGFFAVAGLMVAFGVAMGRALVISGLTLVVINLFFVKVMRIPLPPGLLAPLSGWL